MVAIRTGSLEGASWEGGNVRFGPKADMIRCWGALFHPFPDQHVNAYFSVRMKWKWRRRQSQPVTFPRNRPDLLGARPNFIPCKIDIVFHGRPVELVRPAIRGHRAKQIGSLIIRYLVDGFRLWTRVPHY